jgi:hypothetical protein
MSVGSSEPAWKTYLKSGLFLGPGILAWAFIAVFVLPKLKQIWRDADAINHGIAEFQWMITSVSFAMEKAGVVLLLTLAVLIAMEFTGDIWKRHRKSAMGALVFLLNSAFIVGLVGACLVAAIAGPALIKQP